MKGSYTRRTVDEDGDPEPQKVIAKCETCGATWKQWCTTGQVRNIICRFARVHIHRDPLDPLPKVKEQHGKRK